MTRYFSCFMKHWFIAANQLQYTRTLLCFVVVILMSLSVTQARADEFRDLDNIEALARKWEEVKKDGLSAGDVKQLTDKLKEFGGDEIVGTGRGITEIVEDDSAAVVDRAGHGDRIGVGPAFV